MSDTFFYFLRKNIVNCVTEIGTEHCSMGHLTLKGFSYVATSPWWCCRIAKSFQSQMTPIEQCSAPVSVVLIVDKSFTSPGQDTNPSLVSSWQMLVPIYWPRSHGKLTVLASSWKGKGILTLQYFFLLKLRLLIDQSSISKEMKARPNNVMCISAICSVIGCWEKLVL